MRSIALLSFCFLLGCHGSTAKREPDEYTGCGKDENWRTFDDQEGSSTVADATAPLITQPMPGATVASSPKVTVAWQQDQTNVGAIKGDVDPSCPQWNTGALGPLHLPPISGSVYDLQFSIGTSVVWRVITTLQEWTPTDATWAGWKGKTLSLKIWRMAVLRDDVKQGPFVGTQPFTFSEGN
jgi:hypothetical protein